MIKSMFIDIANVSSQIFASMKRYLFHRERNYSNQSQDIGELCDHVGSLVFARSDRETLIASSVTSNVAIWIRRGEPSNKQPPYFFDRREIRKLDFAMSCNLMS